MLLYFLQQEDPFKRQASKQASKQHTYSSIEIRMLRVLASHNIMRNSLPLLSAFFLLLGSASAFLPLRPMWGSTSSSFPDSPFSLNLRVALTQLQMSKEDPLRIIISGAPASGKGTQCEIIKEKFGVVHLSTGDMLRAAVAAGTEVGKLAKDFMDNGKLVPDNVIIGIVSEKPE